MMKLVLFPLVLIALLAAAFVFFRLLKLAGYVAGSTALSIVPLVLSIFISLLLDVKFVALGSGFMSYIYSNEGGVWGFYGIVVSLYLFIMCSSLVVTLMVENLRKTRWGARARFLESFSFKFDKLEEVDERLPDMLRMGAAFWGGFGVFVSYSLIVFLLTNIYNVSFFETPMVDTLSYKQSVNLAIQNWCDAIPVVQTALRNQFSPLDVYWNSFGSGAMMFLTLAYQFLIWPALANFVIKGWEVFTD
ncbi:hypothetical protein [Rubrivirga sp. IMCC43871]|uniref:hypothetical protein n=1 Tax=Rubrivirga sp. IMCC43871 TaxID=3391575 RepID=UPI00398F8F5E